ncbi:hypothetical protein VTJ49DRAFT_2813 [Mycothermus thermophilus]|uniref:Uncharacterized protein n=1 Tax=Humicola insolens TaxID=85995 RepID=A0ABR3VAZ0_HUMIN
MSYVTRRALSTLIPPKVGPERAADWSRWMLTMIIRWPRRRYVAECHGGPDPLRLPSYPAADDFPEAQSLTPNVDRGGGGSKKAKLPGRHADRNTQAIGAAPDAVRMQRVVSFYEKLPRGPAPEVKAGGILGRYQAKHFGKNPTAKRTWSA